MLSGGVKCVGERGGVHAFTFSLAAPWFASIHFSNLANSIAAVSSAVTHK
jgi:hypothetical protein